jgi:ABC-type phosphate/phosphonate transport system substrate-binding protein
MTTVSSGLVAALPMYDWPEVHGATDALWTAVAQILRTAGIDAPDDLDRTRTPMEIWRDPYLLLAQTCGLPFSRHLMRAAHIVGVPAYRLPDVSPGRYCSRIVVRRDDARERLDVFRGAVAAVNMAGSQSGFAALAEAVSPLRAERPFFSAVQLTGTHRASVRAVAARKADIAAIDAVSWELARRHEPAARGLRVLASTAQTPGLPLITSQHRHAETIAGCVSAAIASLPPQVRDALLLECLKQASESDYRDFAARCEVALATGNTGLESAQTLANPENPS